MIYNKDNPSQQYIDLVNSYKIIHKTGAADKTSDETYNGTSTIKFAELIKKVIKKNNYKTLLDYGSGKGDNYYNKTVFTDKTYPPLNEFWNIKTSLFDPGVPHPRPTDKFFDIVISIDVLEHIPYQDLSWVINEIFEYATKMVFINVACYKANAKLPDGNNAHVSVFDPMWWCGFISAIASNYNVKVLLACNYKKEDKIKFLFYNINDDFNNYK